MDTTSPTLTDAMFLTRLEGQNLRNLEPFQLDFRASLNLIVGENAQGKTNLLEAIYLATALKAFRASRNRELIRWDASDALLRADLRMRLGTRALEVKLGEKSRRVKVDGKSVQSLEEFASAVKVVLFTPEDLSMIRGAPVLRRSFLDRAIYHLYPRHAEIVRDYTQVITQKNKLLSQGETSSLLLSVWDERQVELGSRVMVARSRFAQRIQPLFAENFREISGTGITARLLWRPSHATLEGLEGPELRRAFAQTLEQHADEERRRGQCVVGPHRDELEVTLDGHDAATYGSQGQARMLALCLKIVELRVLLEDRGIVPLFLLDDVSSELDSMRNRYLMAYLSRVGCQVFVTTTATQHVPTEGFDQVDVFRVIAGNVQRDLSVFNTG